MDQKKAVERIYQREYELCLSRQRILKMQDSDLRSSHVEMLKFNNAERNNDFGELEEELNWLVLLRNDFGS